MSQAFEWFPQLAVVVFFLAAGLTWLCTGLVRKIAFRFQVLDLRERAPERKLHAIPVPLLGGIGLWIGFAATSLLLFPWLTEGYLLPKHLLGLILAAGLLIIGGIWDDLKDLPPGIQILFPILATLVVIAAGIGVNEITNPIGGTVQLAQWSRTVFTLNDLPYRVTLWADVFTLGWLLSTTYATKFLDGLDGLVAGITGIGALVIAFLSYRAPVHQPETALVALALAGAAFGFLIWNRFPARIFLGEGGSTVTGFLLGGLAIISGGKIATALLVLGIPLLDGAFVIGRRLWSGRSPFKGDRTHLHQRLLIIGLTTRQVVWLLYLVTAGFGLSGLFFQGREKIAALAVLLGVLIVIGGLVVQCSKQRYAQTKLPR